MSRLIILLSLIGLSVSALSNSLCNKIVSGYETSDSIYVVCDDLSGITQEGANSLIGEIFKQYKGPRDEIFIFFVSSLEFVGKFDVHPYEIPAENWVADYYTHTNKLVLWPKIDSKTQVFVVQN